MNTLIVNEIEIGKWFENSENGILVIVKKIMKISNHLGYGNHTVLEMNTVHVQSFFMKFSLL